MKFRKLRIAWSVVWGSAVVLLIALWVRSFWQLDSFSYEAGIVNIGGESLRGCMVLHRLDGQNSDRAGYFTMPVARAFLDFDIPGTYFWFRFTKVPIEPTSLTSGAEIRPLGRRTGATILVPMWFPLFVAVGFAATPWFRWPKKFSLRTLLIATTLVAVVLGLIVYAIRQ